MNSHLQVQRKQNQECVRWLDTSPAALLTIFTTRPKVPVTAELVNSVEHRLSWCVAVLELNFDSIPVIVASAMEFPVGAKVFVVNQKGSSASVTPALVALYMTSFMEPSVPAEMSLQNLGAAINLVKLIHLISIKPTLDKSEESSFLDALFFLYSDKEPIWLNNTQLADALYTAR